MYVRLGDGEIRFRLPEAEVERMRAGTAIETRLEFAGGAALTCRIEPGDARAPALSFSSGLLLLQLPGAAVAAWAASEENGIYAEDGSIRISVEKDLRRKTCQTYGGPGASQI